MCDQSCRTGAARASHRRQLPACPWSAVSPGLVCCACAGGEIRRPPATGAPPRNRSHRRRPSGDPELRGSLCLPNQVPLTVAVDVEPSYDAVAGMDLPDGARGPFPAGRLSGREGRKATQRPKLGNGRSSPRPTRKLPARIRPIRLIPLRTHLGRSAAAGHFPKVAIMSAQYLRHRIGGKFSSARVGSLTRLPAVPSADRLGLSRQGPIRPWQCRPTTRGTQGVDSKTA